MHEWDWKRWELLDCGWKPQGVNDKQAVFIRINDDGNGFITVRRTTVNGTIQGTLTND